MRVSDLLPAPSVGGNINEIGETKLLSSTQQSVTEESDTYQIRDRNKSFHPNTDVITGGGGAEFESEGVSDLARNYDFSDPLFHSTLSAVTTNADGHSAPQEEHLGSMEWDYYKESVIGLSSDKRSNSMALSYPRIDNSVGDVGVAITNLLTGETTPASSNYYYLNKSSSPGRIKDAGSSIDGWAFLNADGTLRIFNDDGTTISSTDLSGSLPPLAPIKDSPIIWQTGGDMHWVVRENGGGSSHSILFKSGSIDSAEEWNFIAPFTGVKEIHRVIPPKVVFQEGVGFVDNGVFFISYIDSVDILRVAALVNWDDDDNREFVDLTPVAQESEEDISTGGGNRAITAKCRPTGYFLGPTHLYISYSTRLQHWVNTIESEPALTDWSEHSYPAIVRVPLENIGVEPPAVFNLSATRWEVIVNGEYVDSNNNDGDVGDRVLWHWSFASIDCKFYSCGESYAGIKTSSSLYSRNMMSVSNLDKPPERHFDDTVSYDYYRTVDKVGALDLDFDKKKYLNGFTTPANLETILDDIIDGNTPTLTDTHPYRDSDVYPIATGLSDCFKERGQASDKTSDYYLPEFEHLVCDSYNNLSVGINYSTPAGFYRGSIAYNGTMGSDGDTTVVDSMSNIEPVGNFYIKVTP